jgi:hypothetical protein
MRNYKNVYIVLCKVNFSLSVSLVCVVWSIEINRVYE